MSDTMYTFIWPATQDNEMGCWAQHWTCVAPNIHDAFQEALRQTDGYDWGIREGTSVLIVAGDLHNRSYARVVPAKAPLRLDLPPGIIK